VSADATVSPAEKAQILTEALPYIRRFFGKIVVVKYGGNALAGAANAADGLAQFAADVVLMHSVGMRPVVVHGGGPQIGELLRKVGKESSFVDGLRITDADTLDIVRMVLVGKVNREIVSAINVHGALAVGVSGEDASLLTAKQISAELGFVGEVTDVNTDLVERLMGEELIPVIATIGVDGDGQAYNINADTAAAAIAAALHAEKLVYLTDIDGIRTDVTDAASLLSSVSVKEIDAFIADGTISGGMIPKVEACITAVEGGVGVAHILDGRVPRALLLEIFTPEGIGTMVTAEPSPIEAATPR
jgi:acetylglutamate kinase